MPEGEANHFSYVFRYFDKPGKDNSAILEPDSWELVSPKDAEDRAVFRAEVKDFVITKTYTLKPGDYHIGMELAVKLKEGAAKKDFQYQLTSAHGLHIKGEWYTYTFRNAVMGKTVGNGYAQRTLTAARAVTQGVSGTDHDVQSRWTLDKDDSIHFLGVNVQYFASLIAVDDEQENKNLLEKATPSIEKGQVKAVIKSIDPDLSKFELTYKESHWFSKDTVRDIPFSFHVDERDIDVRLSLEKFKRNLDKTKTGDTVWLRYRKIGNQYWATEFVEESEFRKLFIDDISVEANSRLIDLQAGAEVTDRYLLYNGPVKVRLLKQLEDDEKLGIHRSVDAGLVDRYLDNLHLDKLTDAPTPNWVSENVFAPIGVSKLLIHCTNLMHGILWYLHHFVAKVLPYHWTWGLCVLLLTMMVRGAMFPVSRKQAMTSIKMQQLAPELKKLQEKHKNDRQAMGAAQMELYRKHGVHPLGSCWIILLQMPIFLGLYYALQESIHFRLAPFLWIKNLAAPDMLIPWYEKIPWISTPESYGGFLYLGPFFNLLPVIAVVLMIAQQSMLSPPPADEQQAMQMKMMKYMMVIMGLWFYKVAAGLCIYFIASSMWGFTERKLLPKRKPVPGAAPPTPAKPGLFGKLIDRFMASAGAGQSASTGSTSTSSIPPPTESRAMSKRKHRRNRNKQSRGNRRDETQTGAGNASGHGRPQPNGAMNKVHTWWSNLREWWAEVLKKAEKR